YAWTPDSKALVAAVGGKLRRIDIVSGVSTPIPFTAAVQTELGPLNHHTFRVTNDPLAVRYIRSAQRSPDGTTLLFGALSRLYTQRLPRGRPRVLVEQAAGQFHPTYSPDGRWVAYVTWSDTAGGQLWRVRA